MVDHLRFLPVFFLLLLAATPRAHASASTADAWPQFSVLSTPENVTGDFFINAPLTSISKVAHFLNIGEFNTPASKDSGGRTCDVVLAIRAELGNSSGTGTLLVVTDRTGSVPPALFDNDANHGSYPFEEASQHAFAISTTEDGKTGIYFEMTLVCALLPPRSAFDTVDSVQLPIVNDSPPSVSGLLRGTMQLFADDYAAGRNQTGLMEAFGIAMLRFNTSFTVANSSNVVPLISFSADALKEVTDGAGFLVNSPLRSISQLAAHFVGNEKVNSEDAKRADQRTCDIAVGIVRGSESNTVAVVSSPSSVTTRIDIPAALFVFDRNAPSALLRAVEDDVRLVQEADKRDAIKFHFAFVCAEFAELFKGDVPRYDQVADLLPPLNLSAPIAALLKHKFNNVMVAGAADGAMSEAQLVSNFGLEQLSSEVAFLQNPQAVRTPNPTAPRSDPDHLTTGGKLAITVACLGLGVVVVYVLRLFREYRRVLRASLASGGQYTKVERAA